MSGGTGEMCRLCAGSTLEMGVSFLDIIHQNILKEVVSALNLEINTENGFPTKICFNCLLVLTNWITVKEKSETCHKIFCQRLGVSETKGKIISKTQLQKKKTVKPRDQVISTYPSFSRNPSQSNYDTHHNNTSSSELYHFNPAPRDLTNYGNKSTQNIVNHMDGFRVSQGLPRQNEYMRPHQYEAPQSVQNCPPNEFISTPLPVDGQFIVNQEHDHKIWHRDLNTQQPKLIYNNDEMYSSNQNLPCDYINTCSSCNEMFENEHLLRKHIQDVHSVGSRRKPHHQVHLDILEPVVQIQEVDVTHETPVKSRVQTTLFKDTFDETLNTSLEDPLLVGQGETPEKDETEIKRTIECRLCERSYLQSNMILHLKTKHGIGEEQISNYFQHTLIICSFCGKTFDMHHKLKQHLVVHKLPHSCYVCKKRFKSKEKMLEHRTKSHEKQDFICDICNKRLTLKSSLSRHIVTRHFGFRNIECKYCPSKFKTSVSYNSHLLSIHRRDRPIIKCELCKMFFKYTRELLKHYKQYHPHTTPYSCNFCGKKLSSKRNLIEHTTRVHKKKSFTCEQCGKDFVNKHVLSQHQLTHDTFNFNEKMYNIDTNSVYNMSNSLYNISDTSAIIESGNNIVVNKTVHTNDTSMASCDDNEVKTEVIEEDLLNRAGSVIPVENSTLGNSSKLISPNTTTSAPHFDKMSMNSSKLLDE